ncbi:copper-binding protein [Rhodoblastus sp.]|uniref:copper-binding protein n=1 Tax=Rhodoblastus sp. TaxID=1962975 RepID=UPI002618748D|nr:copper-binding protein [Rhodoblastus sp.]
MRNFQFSSRVRLGFAIAVALSGAAPFLVSGQACAASAIVVAQAEKPIGQGTVNAIDESRRLLNITHGPIAALDWPGMTMNFGVAPSVDLKALKAGAKISFTLTRGADGMYVIDAVKPAQ